MHLAPKYTFCLLLTKKPYSLRNCIYELQSDSPTHGVQGLVDSVPYSLYFLPYCCNLIIDIDARLLYKLTYALQVHPSALTTWKLTLPCWQDIMMPLAELRETQNISTTSWKSTYQRGLILLRKTSTNKSMIKRELQQQWRIPVCRRLWASVCCTLTDLEYLPPL